MQENSDVAKRTYQKLHYNVICRKTQFHAGILSTHYIQVIHYLSNTLRVEYDMYSEILYHLKSTLPPTLTANLSTPVLRSCSLDINLLAV